MRSTGQNRDKAKKIAVNGRLVFDQWTTEDGQKRVKAKIYAESVELLDWKIEETLCSPKAAIPRMIDAARRADIRTVQNMPYVCFPLDCICSCGFDFVDYPKAYKEIITGCQDALDHIVNRRV